MIVHSEILEVWSMCVDFVCFIFFLFLFCFVFCFFCFFFHTIVSHYFLSKLMPFHLAL